MTVPVYFIQIGFISLLSKINLNTTTYTLIYYFLIIALSEEFFKYLVIKLKVINSPNLDEPLDIMLYMVVAALGFAAVENVLYLPPLISGTSGTTINGVLILDFIRFIGTTFLHTLCSAVIGYFMAISFYQPKNKKLILSTGILTAVLLHGLYDFSIMTVYGDIKFVIPAIIIITLAFSIFHGFDKLKKMEGICKIK